MMRTHCYDDAKQTAYYAVNHGVKLLVTSFGTVKRPICVFFLHTKTEQVRFSHYKV